MRRIIFVLMAMVLFFSPASAQLLKRSKKSKDPHLSYSTYEPIKDRRIEKEREKKAKELASQSYSKKKSPHLKKQEFREEKIRKKRVKRLRDGKDLTNDKKSKRSQKNYQKKYNRNQRARSNEIKQNKKNFGTKASRKNFNTRKSDRYVLEYGGKRRSN